MDEEHACRTYITDQTDPCSYINIAILTTQVMQTKSMLNSNSVITIIFTIPFFSSINNKELAVAVIGMTS